MPFIQRRIEEKKPHFFNSTGRSFLNKSIITSWHITRLITVFEYHISPIIVFNLDESMGDEMRRPFDISLSFSSHSPFISLAFGVGLVSTRRYFIEAIRGVDISKSNQNSNNSINQSKVNKWCGLAVAWTTRRYLWMGIRHRERERERMTRRMWIDAGFECENISLERI